MTPRPPPPPILFLFILLFAPVAASWAFSLLDKPHAFLVSYRTSAASSKTRLYSDRGKNGKTKFGQKTDADVSRFLKDFRTADGQVVDCYKLLQVKRSATSMEIKQSYRRLSRKLHPDMVAQSSILPGNW